MSPVDLISAHWDKKCWATWAELNSSENVFVLVQELMNLHSLSKLFSSSSYMSEFQRILTFRSVTLQIQSLAKCTSWISRLCIYLCMLYWFIYRSKNRSSMKSYYWILLIIICLSQANWKNCWGSQSIQWTFLCSFQQKPIAIYFFSLLSLPSLATVQWT